jgi:pyruvate dehydrogenase E1 component alpha subunit
MKTYSYLGKGYENYPKLPAGIDATQLISSYEKMLRIREIEWEIVRRYPQDEMKTPVHLAIGHEASVVGVCEALRKEDKVFCGHRTHGVYLAKGGSLLSMMKELYGKKDGCSGSRGGSMHLIDLKAGVEGVSAIVGGIVPIAAGSAFAMKQRKENNITVVFLGDAAMEEGSVLETLNFSVLWKLPVLFVCENNFYSVCTPLHKRQPDVSITAKAKAFGLSAEEVDGNNFLDVFQAARMAVEGIRRGEGPKFIETKVYRWLSHVGHLDDTASGYRSEKERDSWKEQCPVELLEKFLCKNNLLDAESIERKKSDLRQEIVRTFDEAKNSAFPDPSTVLDHVYS